MVTADAAKSLQSCPTLCDPIERSPPGPPIPGILQARTLEWVAISFPDTWKWKVKVKSVSHIRLFATPRTAAHQAPPSMGFSRQEYWSGVPLQLGYLNWPWTRKDSLCSIHKKQLWGWFLRKWSCWDYKVFLESNCWKPKIFQLLL